MVELTEEIQKRARRKFKGGAVLKRAKYCSGKEQCQDVDDDKRHCLKSKIFTVVSSE